MSVEMFTTDDGVTYEYREHGIRAYLLDEDGRVLADSTTTQEWPAFYARGWRKYELHRGYRDVDATRVNAWIVAAAVEDARELADSGEFEKFTVTAHPFENTWTIDARRVEDGALVHVAEGPQPVQLGVEPDAWLAAFDAELARLGWMRAGGWLSGSTSVRVVPNELI